MTNSRSMGVINDAYDMELQLNWILFKTEQDKILWGDGPLPLTWRPGVPLYARPIFETAWDPFENQVVMEAVRGNFTRAMVEEFDETWDDITHTTDFFEGDDEFENWIPMCRDCEVSWHPWLRPSICWSCGKDYTPKAKIQLKKSDIKVSLHTSDPGVRGSRPMYSIMDEGTPNEQVRDEDGEWVYTHRIPEDVVPPYSDADAAATYAFLQGAHMHMNSITHFDVETFVPPEVDLSAWRRAVSASATAAGVSFARMGESLQILVEAYHNMDGSRLFIHYPRRAGRSNLFERLRNGTLNSQSSRPRWRQVRRRDEHECPAPQTNRTYPGSTPITQQRRRRNL